MRERIGVAFSRGDFASVAPRVRGRPHPRDRVVDERHDRARGRLGSESRRPAWAVITWARAGLADAGRVRGAQGELVDAGAGRRARGELADARRGRGHGRGRRRGASSQRRGRGHRAGRRAWGELADASGVAVTGRARGQARGCGRSGPSGQDLPGRGQRISRVTGVDVGVRIEPGALREASAWLLGPTRGTGRGARARR